MGFSVHTGLVRLRPWLVLKQEPWKMGAAGHDVRDGLPIVLIP